MTKKSATFYTGEKLRAWMTESGVNQTELAKRLGVPRNTMHYIIEGVHMPRAALMYRIYCITSGAAASDFTTSSARGAA